MRSKKKRLAWLNQAEVENVAEQLGVKAKEVLEMEKRLSSPDMGFDLPDHADEEDSAASYSPAAYLSEDTDTPEIIAEENDWQAHQNSQLKIALQELDERSRDIIAKRWLAEKKTTLQDLAKEYDISAERIRQLENNAIKKLRSVVLEA